MTSLFAATASAAIAFDMRMGLSRFPLADREPLRCMDSPATQPPGLSPVADALQVHYGKTGQFVRADN
jgi:hypothetical protein